MKMKNYTLSELERAAYMSGNIQLSNALFDAMKFEIANDDCGPLDLESPIDAQLEEMTSKAIADNCPDYEEYKQFFDDCFSRLNSYYPCPSVTSDYDQSVIFDAISKGDAE